MAKDRREPTKGATPRTEAGVPHHTITSLEVTGGFLEGCKLEFVDGLNCVIGGRGTGKSTVLEFIRHAASATSDARTNPARAKLVESNLKNGRVRVQVQTKHGMHYTAERPAKDTAQILNERNEATALSFGNDKIFQLEAYSQNDIEDLAVDPSLQLELIDRVVDEDVQRVDAEIRKVDRELTQNAADILRLQHEVRELAEGALEAPGLEEKLKGLRLASGPDASAMNAAHARRALREKERTGVEALRADIVRLDKTLETSIAGVRRGIESRLDTDLDDSPNEDVLTKVRDEVLEVTQLLARALAKVKQQSVTADGALEKHQKTLAERHAKQEAEYRTLLAKSQEESGRATERIKLEQRHLAVVTAKKDLEHRRAELRQEGEHRGELLARLSGLRDDRFDLRRTVAEQFTEALKPAIRVSVRQQAGHQKVEALLHEGLRGSGVKYDKMVEAIIAGLSPTDLARLVQTGDVEEFADRVGMEVPRARKIIDNLKDTPLVYQIETVEMEDQPHIELLDGDGYKDSADLSTGQRCTAVLPILLLESERPLLVDQPEDNLDNAFIYLTVVKTLKSIKRKRQLIFVTHNPNIPVLGDADRVFIMESNGKRGRLKAAGTVDALKREVEFLLEGGTEAFLLRKQRYGH